jgi:hypothetical protein
VPPTHVLGHQDPADLAALHLDAVALSGFDQRVQRPLRRSMRIWGVELPASRALRPPRRPRSSQGDDLAPLGFGDTAFASRSGPVTKPVQASALNRASRSRTVCM